MYQEFQVTLGSIPKLNIHGAQRNDWGSLTKHIGEKGEDFFFLFASLLVSIYSINVDDDM